MFALPRKNDEHPGPIDSQDTLVNRSPLIEASLARENETMKPVSVRELQHRIGSYYPTSLLTSDPCDQKAADPSKTTEIDPTSAGLAQFATLFKSINETTTDLGARALMRSIFNPARDPSVVLARQEAVRALEQSEPLQKALESFIACWKAHEVSVLSFSRVHLGAPRASDYEAVGQAFREMVQEAKKLSTGAPLYIQALTQELIEFPEKRIYRLFNRELIALGYGKVGLPEEAGIIRRIRGSYTRGPTDYIDAERIAMIGVGLEVGARLLLHALLPKERPPQLLEMTRAGAYPIAVFLAAQTGMLFNKRSRDSRRFFSPLISEMYQDEGYTRVLNAIGQIDELQSVYRSGKNLPQGGSFPAISFGRRHFFRATALHNLCLVRDPSLLREGETSIPNDFEIDGEKLVALTGYNSAGKTTAAATVLQTEVQGLLGGRVPGRNVSFNVADRWIYQSHELSSLEGKTGKMGTESEITRKTLEQLTAQSVWIADELLQGSTQKESRASAGRVLDAAQQCGVSVLFITHDAILIDQLLEVNRENPIVKALRFKAEDGKTTHQLETGISREGHSNEVLREERLTTVDLENLIRARGVLDARSLERWELDSSVR